MKILVIEDDVLLTDFIARCLRESGFDVDTAHDGRLGYAGARKRTHELIILDINLPNMLGTEICSRLRREDIMTPILFLSSNQTTSDRVNGLNLGADDYLVKPFSHDELVARVKALSRRPASLISSPLKHGDLLIDTSTHEVFVRGNGVRLTPKEFQLLERLARNPGVVVAREVLLEQIWNVSMGSTSNRLEVCIRGLRKKLGLSGGKEYIETEYGIGYRLVR